VTFASYLEVLIFFYCNPCPCGQIKDEKSDPTIPSILSSWDLDVQQGLFKLTTKSNIVQAMAKVMALRFDKVNRTIINPLTHMW
jgi:hypothetical protein